ncbi:MAG UNVERIFIED_CONTAM: hypothetical protein LVR18_14505 [Planctomycetaceae bacterium]
MHAGGLQVDSIYSPAPAGSADDRIEVSPEAMLGGSGQIHVGIELGGLLSPGPLAEGSSPGSLTVNSLNMSPGSSLKIQIDAADAHDSVIVTDAVSLDGTLEVQLAPDYTPEDGTAFTILSADSVSGRFSTFRGLEYPGGALVPIQTPTGLLLVATSFTGKDAVIYVSDTTPGTEVAGVFAPLSSQAAAFSGSLTFSGQELAGNFTLSRRAATATLSAAIVADVDAGELQVVGEQSLLQLSQGSGRLVLLPEGVAGQLSVTLADSLDSLDLSSAWELSVNTATVAVDVDDQIKLEAGSWLRLARRGRNCLQRSRCLLGGRND